MIPASVHMYSFDLKPREKCVGLYRVRLSLVDGRSAPFGQLKFTVPVGPGRQEQWPVEEGDLKEPLEVLSLTVREIRCYCGLWSRCSSGAEFVTELRH